MASENFDTHVAKYHRETCNGTQHWILCSKPESFEKTQTLVSCPPDCRRSSNSSNFTVPKRPLSNDNLASTSTAATASTDHLTDMDPTCIILQRYYELNRSGTKSLQIGINITTDLNTEILFTLTDNTRNRKILFDLQTWQNLLKNDQILHEYLTTGRMPLSDSEITIPLNPKGDIYIVCRKLYNKNAICFSSVTDKAVNIAMLYTSYKILQQCIPSIDSIVDELKEIVEIVDSRVRQSVELLATTMQENVCDENESREILIRHHSYNPQSLIDTDLFGIGLEVLIKAAERMDQE